MSDSEQDTTIGQAFTALTISQMVGQAQAAQIKALVDSGQVAPEQAVDLVARTHSTLLENGASIISAFTSLAVALPELFDAFDRFSNNPFIKHALDEAGR